MVLIALTKGKFAAVDEHYYLWLNGYKWYATKSAHNWYARRTKNGKQIYMHRFIMAVTDGRQVHHGEGGTLDNRRCNLTVCSQSENLSKRKYKHGGKK